MPKGGNPKIAEYGKNTRFGTKRGYDAVKAAKKSNESQRIMKSLNEDLKEQCTPEKLNKINARVIAMAERGNLKAYELIRDGLGEKPSDNVKVTNTMVNSYDELSVEELRKLASMTGGDSVEDTES